MCNVEIQDALAKENKRPGGMEVFVINTAKQSRERERQRQEGVARKNVWAVKMFYQAGAAPSLQLRKRSQSLLLAELQGLGAGQAFAALPAHRS